MLAVGIPQEAVKNKMVMTGFDPEIIETPDSIVKIDSSSDSDSSRGALLADIKGGISLKKVSANKKTTINDDRVEINLNEILDARNGLKKREGNKRPYWK